MQKKILPRRKKIRLDPEVYNCGYFFVTICTKKNKYEFGKVVDSQMSLNKRGELIEKKWK